MHKVGDMDGYKLFEGLFGDIFCMGYVHGREKWRNKSERLFFVRVRLWCLMDGTTGLGNSDGTGTTMNGIVRRGRAK